MSSMPRTAVPSPCNNVCRMDPHSGWCLGCQRTLDEISAWSAMEDTEKRRVWQLLERRRAALAAQPYGGLPP
jgi:predicted Fe-S protein YdhL (DUF1289 family)